MKLLKRIFLELKQWRTIEIVFSSILVLMAVLMSTITAAKLNIELSYILFTIFSVVSFIFLAKGTFIGYLLAIGSLVWYSFIAYSQSFYGELIASWVFLFPYVIGELVVWFKPSLADKNTTKIKLFIEIVLVFLCIGGLGYGSLNLLSILNCNSVVISAIAVCLSCLVLYFSSFKTKIFEVLAYAGYCGCAIYLYVQSSINIGFNYILVALSFALLVIASLAVCIKRIYNAIVRIRNEKREHSKIENKQEKVTVEN